MDELLSEFLTECFEGMATLDAELVRFERQPDNPERIAGIFRIIHTIKGTCGFLALTRLERVSHAAESVLGRIRDGQLQPTPAIMGPIFAAVDRIRLILDGLAAHQAEPEGDDDELIAALEAVAAGNAAATPYRMAPGQPAREQDLGPRPQRTADGAPDGSAAEMPAADEGAAEAVSAQTLRVRLDLLEQLMTLAGELVLTRNQLLQATRHKESGDLTGPVQRLDHITAELQETVMRTRMQPIGSAWSRLPRLVRDLEQELGKRIELQLHGAETELDREVLELIKDPLIHMVRNSADHGLERPEERRACGKPERGLIRLTAAHEGGHIIIRISDDGRGLDLAGIKAKALAKGLASEAELAGMTAQQIGRFIFAPGFSTAGQVSSISGRGVGMDVVRTNIERIGGSIELAAEPGHGTSFTIKIPLTLAIVSVLIVGAGEQRFGIPQLDVLELVRTGGGTEHRIERIGETPILRLRDRLLPLVSLADLLALPSAVELDRPAYVVVVRVGSRCVGLLVDRVFDTEEIVVKPLAPILRDLRMFSGNTILGDGGVIMILDLNALLSSVEGMPAGAGEIAAEPEAGAETMALLLFRAGARTPRAVPLGLVTRLEEVSAEAIEWSGGRTVVQYRGQLMPLVDINGAPARPESGSRPVLVFTDSGRHMGLVVDEIIDITDAGISLELQGDGSGTLGSAIIHGRSTELLDVAHFVNQVFGGWFADPETRPFAGGKDETPQRVLLVDDSSFFRNLLKPILETGGYQVTLAAGPDQALRMRDEGERFDIIVSDIEMPGMSGFDFAAACRTSGAWRTTPIIALSSHTAPGDLARGREVGFSDYVGKLDRAALIEALHQARELHREAA